MDKIKDLIKEDGIEFEAYKCNSCGEEIMNMNQLNNLAEKYRKLRKAKKITFAKWGNSIAVRIPNEIARELKIKPGKEAFINNDKEGIRIITN
ncbi:MAG: AbrB/MazE/SpoVT family DNA-binding domain-containing protein [Nanoarchaeota archaeon]